MLSTFSDTASQTSLQSVLCDHYSLVDNTAVTACLLQVDASGR